MKAAKAIYATIIAALTALGGFLVNDTSLGDITAGQWLYVVLAAVIAGSGVYGISNAPPDS